LRTWSGAISFHSLQKSAGLTGGLKTKKLCGIVSRTKIISH